VHRGCRPERYSDSSRDMNITHENLPLKSRYR
jgi:hypothetical protein